MIILVHLNDIFCNLHLGEPGIHRNLLYIFLSLILGHLHVSYKKPFCPVHIVYLFDLGLYRLLLFSQVPYPDAHGTENLEALQKKWL